MEGLRLNLTTSESVIEAYHQITDTLAQNVPDAHLSGVLVCKQADPGIEMIVGGIQDVMFGPCLMVGLGGIFIEVLKDVAFRVIPLNKIDALEMLKELRGYPVLLGARGGEKADIDSLAEFLLRVSDFFQANPWIKELDINPVRVSGNKITILDIRIVK